MMYITRNLIDITVGGLIIEVVYEMGINHPPQPLYVNNIDAEHLSDSYIAKVTAALREAVEQESSDLSGAVE